MIPAPGIWKPVFRQATFGETPFHEVKHGEIDVLVINEDGTGYAEHPKLFKVVHHELTCLETDDPNLCIIGIPEQKLTMLATIDEHGNLLAKWECKSIAFNNYGVVYERQ